MELCSREGDKPTNVTYFKVLGYNTLQLIYSYRRSCNHQKMDLRWWIPFYNYQNRRHGQKMKSGGHWSVCSQMIHTQQVIGSNFPQPLWGACFCKLFPIRRRFRLRRWENKKVVSGGLVQCLFLLTELASRTRIKVLCDFRHICTFRREIQTKWMPRPIPHSASSFQ